MTYDYAYRSFPSGNQQDFDWIASEMRKRDVALEYVETLAGGRIYRLPRTDIHKLPEDARGPYFGDENEGYSLMLEISDEEIETMWRGEWCGGNSWKAI